MEKRFLKFLLFGVFTFVFSIAFVGCGDDYDDDIKGLESKNASMQTAIDALNTAKTALETSVANANSKADAAVDAAKAAAVTAAKEEIEKMMNVPDTSAEEVAAVLGQLMELSNQLQGLVPAVNAFTVLKDELVTKADANPSWIDVIIGYNARITALELQRAVLEGYGEGETVKADIAAVKKSLEDQIKALTPGGEGSMTEARVKEIVDGMVEEALALNNLTMKDITDAITSINSGLLTLEGVNKMITGIALVDVDGSTDYGITFSSTTVRRTYKFGGTDYVGIINFDTSKNMSSTRSVVVRVTPANAVLTKEMISLVNSKGEDNISTYVTIKSVDKYTESITRATLPSTGLYEIFFDFDATKADFTNVAGTSGNTPSTLNAFSVAVETSPDRHVLTDFAVTFKSDPAGVIPVHAVSGTDMFQFSVNGTELEDIRNATKDAYWNSGLSAVDAYADNSKNKGTNFDDRTGKNNLLVKVNEPIKVKMDMNKDIADAYAYFIDFDGSSNPSWKVANVSGMNRIYLIGETAELTITDAGLKGYEVGFRVYAVNYDGTYVAPEGKSFYVICDNDLSGTELAFETDITAPFTTSTLSTIAVAIPYWTEANKTKVKTWELSIAVENSKTYMNYATVDPTSSAAGKISITGINPLDLQDNMPYYGTLVLRDENQLQLASYTVKLTKTLPTSVPKGFTMTSSTSAVASDGSYFIVDGVNKDITVIPGITGISGNDPLVKATYTIGTGGIGSNLSLTLTGTGLANNVKNGVTTSTITPGFYSGTPSVLLEYNYGKIKYDETDHKVEVSSSNYGDVTVKSFFAGYQMVFNQVTNVTYTLGADLTMGLPISSKPFMSGADALGAVPDSKNSGFTCFRKTEFTRYMDLSSSKGVLTYTTGGTNKVVDMVIGGKYDSDENLLITIPADALTGMEIPQVGANKTSRTFGVRIDLVDRLGGITVVNRSIVMEIDSSGNVTLTSKD